MKKIFLKQYNALFDYPIVKEPKKAYGKYWDNPLFPQHFYEIDFNKDLEAYNKWLSSKIEIVGEHSFEDGKVYEEDVDFYLKEIGGLFDDGEGFETEVAISID